MCLALNFGRQNGKKLRPPVHLRVEFASSSHRSKTPPVTNTILLHRNKYSTCSAQVNKEHGMHGSSEIEYTLTDGF